MPNVYLESAMKSHPFTVVFLLLLVQLSMSGEIAAAQPPALRIGAAAVDITPPVGYRMSGGYGEAISTGVNDPLFAKALVLRQAGAAAALVICDLTGISRELTEQLRAKAGRE